MNLRKRFQDNKHCSEEVTGPVPPFAVHTSSSEREQYLESSWTFILFYQTILWSGGIYSFYNLYLFSQRWKKTLDLTEKRNFFGATHQDRNDPEWKIFIPLLLEYAPYGIIHLILAQLIKCFCPLFLKIFYITFGSIMAAKIIGLWGMALCYMIPLLMAFVLLSRLRIFVWLTWCLLLVVFNFRCFEELLEMVMNGQGEEQYKTSVIIAWIMLRCVSFCLVTCEEDPTRAKSRLSSFIDILAYSLYFPHFITGPYMPYKDYVVGVNKPFESWNIHKMLWFVGQCARFLFWLWLTDFLLYFFYVHALIDPNYIKGFDSWTTAGYFSFLIIFFILKYVVLYGLPSVLARAEGFHPPEPPRCVIYSEKFSHVWKFFDVGLHRFMVDHIYIPFLGEDATFFRQVQGCVVAFTFVYVWHGAYPSVFWWCAINFSFTVIEKLGDKLVKTSLYKNWKDSWLPGLRGLIFNRIIAGIMLLSGTISILIFLTSTEHAENVFNNIYIKGFPLATVTAVFFFAILAQGGADLHNYRMRRKLKAS